MYGSVRRNATGKACLLAIHPVAVVDEMAQSVLGDRAEIRIGGRALLILDTNKYITLRSPKTQESLGPIMMTVRRIAAPSCCPNACVYLSVHDPRTAMNEIEVMLILVGKNR